MSLVQKEIFPAPDAKGESSLVIPTDEELVIARDVERLEKQAIKLLYKTKKEAGFSSPSFIC